MIIPVNISLKSWAHRLLIDFPNDNLPILGAETRWQEWAARVAASPSFAGLNAPNPYSFKDWRDWAIALFNTNPVPI